jgi:hypothetical protein
MPRDRKTRRPLFGTRVSRRWRPSVDCLEDRRVLSAPTNPIALGFAKDIGGSGLVIGQAIAGDNQGDVYVTGTFSGTANFSPNAGVTSLTSTGSFATYVAKYNSAGGLVWANVINATTPGNVDEGNGIAVSPSGDVYVTGAYSGTVTAGGITLPAGVSGSTNGFVAHYGPTGNLISAVPILAGSATGAIGTATPEGIAADASGDVFLTGSYSGTVNFNPAGSPAVYETAPGGGQQAFFLKLNPNSSFGWVRTLGASGDLENGNAITLDAAGDVYGTGAFINTVDFGSGSVLSSPGSDAAYVLKLDPTGNTIWAKALAGNGGSQGNQGYGIGVDSSGNVYSSGFFTGTTNFNPNPGTADNLTSAGGPDAYISKLDPSGNFLWANQFGGTGQDASKYLALDSAGNVYATGFFQGTATLTPGGQTLSTAGSSGSFVLKFNPAGQYVWGTQYGGTGGSEDQANGIVATPLGSVDVFGSFLGTVNFDPGPTTTTLSSQGSPDAFLSTLVPTAVSVDNDDPGYSVTGTWTTVAGRGGVNNDYQYAAPGDGTTTATWQLAVPTPGTYDVQVTWTPYSNRATNAPYQIYDGNTLLQTVNVNQQNAPSGPTVNGVTYQSLGAYPISSGTLRVVLGNGANNYVVADSVRVAYPTPTPVLLDNDLNYDFSGNWSTVYGRGGNNQDYAFIQGTNSSSTTATATTTAPALTTGYYDVEVTWTPYSNRATNATYSIYDGSKLLGTTTIDQTQNPVGVTSNGVTYQSLGVFRFTSGSASVVLGNNANGYVIADAVRLAPSVSAPTSVDNDDPGYSVTGTWTTVANRGGVNNDYQYAAPSGTGSSTANATWMTTGLAPGAYNVQVTWTAYSNRADNAPYRIYDGNTLLATIRVNQQASPSGGTTQGGVTYQSLGSFQVSSGTLKVVLGNDADNYVVADSIYVAPSAFSTTVINSTNPNYTQVGPWSTAGGGGVGGSYQFAAAGNASTTAVWQVGVPTLGGSYNVSVTWVPYSNRATNATYQVFDGDTLLASVPVNQQLAPSGPSYNGFLFQSLGVFKISTGPIRVVLTNNANGYVIADAIKVDSASTGGFSTIP